MIRRHHSTRLIALLGVWWLILGGCSTKHISGPSRAQCPNGRPWASSPQGSRIQGAPGGPTRCQDPKERSRATHRRPQALWGPHRKPRMARSSLQRRGMMASRAQRVPPKSQATPPRPIRTPNRPRKTIRFVVISDTHDYRMCKAQQGKALGRAVALINELHPDFVVGLGDLVAGGGDCERTADSSEPLEVQLDIFRKEVLDRLEVPFVLVEGNHGLQTEGSSDPKVPRKVWEKFWMGMSSHLLPQARFHKRYHRSYRFRYKGQGFVVLGYYGTFGLDERELDWADAHIQRGDIVFRHVNLFGISCSMPGRCGFAIRSTRTPDYDRIAELLVKRKVKALFSGHTHAFYDGTCNGLRFVNTGSLGSRSMEWVKGWDDSPYRAKQSFVYVEVFPDGKVRTRFFVYEDGCDCFEPFDPANFPTKVTATRIMHLHYLEGVPATCITVREPAPVPQMGRGKSSRTKHESMSCTFPAQSRRLSSKSPTASDDKHGHRHDDHCSHEKADSGHLPSAQRPKFTDLDGGTSL